MSEWINSTTDKLAVLLALETYLDWTLLPLIPLSDFNVGPAQTSWNSYQGLGCRFLVVIPLELYLDWTLPSFQTERLECKTGTKLAKFKNSTAKTWSKEILLLLAMDGALRSQQIKEAASLLPPSDLSVRPAQSSWNSIQPPTWYLLSLVVLPSSANRPGLDVLPLLPLLPPSDLDVRLAQQSWNSTAKPWCLLSLVALPVQIDLEQTFHHCFHCWCHW